MPNGLSRLTDQVTFLIHGSGSFLYSPSVFVGVRYVVLSNEEDALERLASPSAWDRDLIPSFLLYFHLEGR